MKQKRNAALAGAANTAAKKATRASDCSFHVYITRKTARGQASIFDQAQRLARTHRNANMRAKFAKIANALRGKGIMQ